MPRVATIRSSLILAEQQRGDLIALELYQASVLARRWIKAEARLRTAYLQAANDIVESRDAGRTRRLRSFASVAAAAAETDDELRAVVDDISPEIRQGEQLAIRRGVAGMAALASSIAFEVAGVGRAIDEAPIIGAAFKAFKDSASTILKASGPAAWSLIENVLGASSIPGVAISAPDIVDRVMSQGLNKALSYYSLVIRDQVMSAYRTGARTVFSHSGGLITSYKRMANKDAKTCIACIMLDGSEYETDELMHVHPYDRCWMIPVVKGLPVPSWQSGEDWFRDQDESTQRDILGPGIYAGWQSGDFDLDDLVTRTSSNEWGPGLQVTPLKELRR